MQPFTIALCRPDTRSAFPPEGGFSPSVLADNVSVYCDLITRAARDHGARIVAFPDFSLTGYTPLESDVWNEASITFPGPEIERMAQAARSANVFVVVQALERHAAFPGRRFMSAALLTPEGEVGLIHRKSYAMSLRTSPNDVLDRFMEVFGPDAFFPVLDTPLGRMGLLIGAEMHWPEAVRSLALKGAEIVINPVSTGTRMDYMGRAGGEHVRGVRAFENVLYVVVSSSQVFDFNGAAIGQPTGEEGVYALAQIDMEALRRARTSPKANFLAQIQPAIHEPLQNLPLWPPNIFPETAAANVDQLHEVEAAAWRRMQSLGRGRAPAS